MEKEWMSLVELDRYLIEKITNMIGIQTRFVDSNNFDLSGERVQRLINILIQLNATQFISGPAAKDYLTGSEYLFEKNGIELIYKDYSGYTQYKQMREPFVNSVSILDLLVNVKLEEVKDYIWNSKMNVNLKNV